MTWLAIAMIFNLAAKGRLPAYAKLAAGPMGDKR